MPQNRLIVFYDNYCGLCQRSILFTLHHDKQRQFLFAPLSGKTAAMELKNWLQEHPTVDSLVLLEVGNTDQKISCYSKAILRILWHLGGVWAVAGLFAFLPTPFLWPFDCLYRAIAKRRKTICPYSEVLQLRLQNLTRLLP
jgi:predicted DCC family thiol-disulfide oxidoreductase YuxK